MLLFQCFPITHIPTCFEIQGDAVVLGEQASPKELNNDLAYS